MKKTIAVLIAVLMMVSLFAGCGGGSSSSADGDTTTLTFWTQDTAAWQAYFGPALERFEADNPSIKINVEYFSDFAEKVTQSFNAGTEADVIFTYSSIGDFAKAGQIQEVPESAYTTEELQSTFF